MKKIIALVLFLAAGYFGYQMYNKPVDKINDLKAYTTISAIDLFEAFETDEAKANREYLDKVIVARGKVLSTDVKGEQTTIFLETDDMLGTVLCQLESPIDNLPEKGSTVSIKGLCTGFLTDVVLVRAKILN